ncbi:hypothetical protein LINGRAHAP2_LOCUS30105 [Linum grandiflorum]
MRCSAHVLNLIVKNRLEIIKVRLRLGVVCHIGLQLLRELSSLKSLLSKKIFILVQSFL